MPLKITLPETEGRKKAAKDIIITILSHEWPLSTKKIYSTAVKKHAAVVSYQAVHKAVKELVSEKVIARHGREYAISIDWIRQLNDFSRKLNSNYTGNNIPLVGGIKGIEVSGNMTTLTFDNLLSVDDFLMEMERAYLSGLEKGKKGAVFYQLRHDWWPLIYSSYVARLTKKIKIYMIIGKTTPLDKWVAEYYKRMGYKIRAVRTMCNDIGAIGDTVIEIFCPKRLNDAIDAVYSGKNIQNIDIPDFVRRVLEKKTEIQVVVIKSKPIADKIRKQIISNF